MKQITNYNDLVFAPRLGLANLQLHHEWSFCVRNVSFSFSMAKTISNILLYLSNISFCVTAVHKFFIPPFRVVYITFVVTLTGLCHLIRETITW